MACDRSRVPATTARGHHLVEDLVVDAARTTDGIEVDVAAIRHRPFEQAFAADAEAVLFDLRLA
jgi:hypothetical protein